MAAAINDLLLVVLIAVAGILSGWWLRSGSRRTAGNAAGSGEAGSEVQRAREILARLHEVASRVAADVGMHNERVEEINEELSSADGQESDAVVGAVAKLLDANQQMQEQLHSAQGKLREQAREIECRAAEARTDALTGLANRRALDMEIERRLTEFQRRGKPFSLMMIDVDHFKRFNDTHGHQAGDEVLRGVADVLRKNARESDLVARYGGEEFAVVLGGASVAETLHVVDRFRRAIDNARFRFEGAPLHVTASMGVAGILARENAAGLIGRADEALYASKQAGRNCAHWHDGREIRAIRIGGGAEGAPAGEARRADPPRTESPATAPRPPSEPGPSPDVFVHLQPGLPNRTAFCTMLGSRLAEWRRGGGQPAALLLHIDRYVEIVAARGQQVGSQMQRAVFRLLMAAIREMDLIAHYDCDTFAVLLPGLELAATVNVAERLRQAIAQSALATDNGPLRFTVSVGGAEAMDGDDTATLLRRTQEALEAAVKSGGNCCYFHNGQWSETLLTALERAQAGAQAVQRR